ncbi:hypothetical protein [Stenotrophomonas sp. 24(2023)]|uniref:hypothetical protein n=1 Tax=Stenotrophomonas sp. 24(2023) TaxID=3068324 RepID=UPI0027E050CD|nr:hypothetical protein [Stenotrophomonas sp. 24(2023)]WMJ69236.1 hypothetical protein Q9R17_19000 [Stenotrophomonas sp. 24(2023)]
MLLPALAMLVMAGCSNVTPLQHQKGTDAPDALHSGIDPQVLNACYVQCNKDLDACLPHAVSPEARTECSRTYTQCRRNCE